MRIVNATVVMLLGLALSDLARAQSERHSLDIKAQSIKLALRDLGEQTGIQILFRAEDVARETATTPHISGEMSPREALERLLEKVPGLKSEWMDSHTVLISAKDETSADKAGLLLGGREMRLAQVDADSEVASSGEGVARASGSVEHKSETMEVVVTGAKRKFAPIDSSAATKIPMEIIDTPQSMSVLSSEFMSIVGATNMTKAMEWAASVTNSSPETSAYNQAWVRGFELSDFNSYKINGASFSGLLIPLDLSVVDAVEIVRGPASIVYGESDYGGTVNVRLKRPQTKRAFIGGLGSDVHGSKRLLADVTGALTADERLRGRLSVSYGDNRSPQSLAYSRSTTIAPSLSWDVTDKDTLDVNVILQHRPVRWSFGFGLTEDNRLPAISKKAFMSPDFAVGETDTKLGMVQFSHRFNERWKLMASGLAGEIPRKENNVTLFSPIPASGDVSLYQSGVVSRIRDYSGDLTLMGDFMAFGSSHTLALSATTRRSVENYFSIGSGYLDGAFNVYDPAGNTLIPRFTSWPSHPERQRPDNLDYDLRGDQRSKGLSAMLLLHPLPRTTLLMGLRSTDFELSTGGFYDRSGVTTYDSHATNKRFGLVYEAVDDVNLYASYSDGTTPNNYTRTVSGGMLPPETGVQLEAGVKAALFGKRLTLASSVFQIDRQNIAVPDPTVPIGSPFSIAIDGQKHRGIEFEAIGEPIPGLNVMASYSYLDIEIDMCARVEGACTDPFGWNGHQQPNSPKSLFKLYGTYQILNGPLRGLSLGGGVIRAGEREVESSGLFQLPAYTRVDMRLGYDALEHVSFSLNAINLTDADIYTSNFSYPYGGIDYQDRRTLMFDVSFKY